MSCNGTTGELKIVQGSIEYIYAELSADRMLDDQAISMAVTTAASPGSWVAASWVGEPGFYREARILLDGSLTPGRYNVFARISDQPEAPIINVGKLRII